MPGQILTWRAPPRAPPRRCGVVGLRARSSRGRRSASRPCRAGARRPRRAPAATGSWPSANSRRTAGASAGARRTVEQAGRGVLVRLDGRQVERRQRRLVAAQREQRAVQRLGCRRAAPARAATSPAARPRTSPRPAGRGTRRARRTPANSRAPPLAHGLRQLRVGVAREVVERRGLAVLLAHEQQRHERREQHQRRRQLGGLRVDQRGQPAAAGPVADLVVVLRVGHEAGARSCHAGRAPWRRPRNARALAGVDVALAERARQLARPRRSRRSSRRARRSAARAGRGGRRRTTARPGRARRRARGCTTRGSLRSLSAIRWRVPAVRLAERRAPRRRARPGTASPTGRRWRGRRPAAARRRGARAASAGRCSTK